MKEEIIKVLKRLKRSYIALWLIPVVYIILGETDAIPVGALVDDVRGSYFMESISILLMAVSVPLSLKLFSLVLNKKIDTYTFPVALMRYAQWSLVRMAVLEMAILFCLTSYYLTLSSTGVLCAFIGLAASLFCMPSEKKLNEELHIESE